MNNGIKILIVDDEAQLRELTMKILSEFNPGLTIFEAENGKKALDLILVHDFDLIISDVIMPEMNGHELKMAADEFGIGVPFIFITGYTDDKTREALQEKGKLLYKPISAHTLNLEVLESLGLCSMLPVPDVHAYV